MWEVKTNVNIFKVKKKKKVWPTRRMVNGHVFLIFVNYIFTLPITIFAVSFPIVFSLVK